MPSYLTTVQQELVEVIRVMEGVRMRDSIEAGEEITRFPRGTSLDAVRAELIRLAMASRGVDYSADCFCQKGIWERFISLRYQAGWEIDPATGTILTDREQKVTETAASITERERLAFEAERLKRQRAHDRAASRGKNDSRKRTAENH